MAAVFLDLDGTMTDPKPGITAAVQHALREVGLSVPPADDLTWVIGPPLLDSFRELGVPDPQAALMHYRAHYDDGRGLYDAVVHDGIIDGMAALRAAGHRLYVATAKPIVVARKVTEYFGLNGYFEAEFGPELDGTRNDKVDLLAHALSESGEEAAGSVMVGDRHHDVRAAHANGMPAIAVTWGYGTPEEHAPANAILSDSREFGPGILRFLSDM
jgi:phosphoglycolate phosphatase